MKDFLKILNGRREDRVVWTRFSESLGVSCVEDEEVKPTDKNSGSESLVAMMKTAEDRDGDDFALVRPVDFPSLRRAQGLRGDWAVAVEVFPDRRRGHLVS